MANEQERQGIGAILRRGGTKGAAAGAMVGGVQSILDESRALSGYNVNFSDPISRVRDMQLSDAKEQRTEESHTVQMIKGAQAIRSKALEIRQAEREDKVSEIKQAGHEADAKMFSDRAVNLYKHVDSFKDMDDEGVRQKVLTSVTNANVQDLEFVNHVATNTPYLNSQEGYEIVKKQAERSGISLGSLGLPEQWSPQVALQWKGTAEMAKSVREARAEQNATQSKRTHELTLQALKGDQQIQQTQAKIESAEKIAQFEADVALEKQRMSQAASRGSVARADLGDEGFETNTLKNTNMLRMVLPEWNNALGEVKPGTEVYQASTWMNDQITNILQKESLLFNQKITNRLPRTYSEVAHMIIPQVISRIDMDGNFYEGASAPELEKDKQEWFKGVLTNPKAVVADKIAEYEILYGDDPVTLKRMTDNYLEGLWSSPAARGFSTGTTDYGTSNTPVRTIKVK